MVMVVISPLEFHIVIETAVPTEITSQLLGLLLAAQPLLAQEHLLKLHHPGVREEEGRIVCRNERRAEEELVSPQLEVV